MKKPGLTVKESLEVRRVVVAYCIQLIEYMKSIDDNNIEKFKKNMYANHEATLAYLQNAVNEYKNDRMKVEFISQSFINLAYDEFYELLPYYENALNSLEGIIDNPDTFIDKHLNSVMESMLPETVPMQVIGYRKEYVPTLVKYETCQNEIDDYRSVEHIWLYVKDDENHLYAMNIYESEDECYSGYTTADYGNCDITRVESYDITSKPKTDMTWDCPADLYFDDISSLAIGETLYASHYEDVNIEIPDVLKVSYDEGDEYYPSGYVEFKTDLFTEPDIRQLDKAPLWIFKGGSGLGKSYLSHRIGDKIVWESDSYSELPERILADIIVLGNKYNYTVEDVDKLVPYEHETIIVDFSK